MRTSTAPHETHHPCRHVGLDTDLTTCRWTQTIRPPPRPSGPRGIGDAARSGPRTAFRTSANPGCAQPEYGKRLLGHAALASGSDSLDRRVNMRRQNVECRPRCVRWFRAIGLTFTGTLLAAASSHAGVLDVSWTGPTKNTDRSSWADLALYRVYHSTSASPCPGSSFVQVAASTLSRSPNQTVSLQLTGLTTGSTYRVSVTTVDRDGKESECSAVASAVAEGDSAVTPTGPVSFGMVTIGSSATRTFTVRSTGTGTIAGTASVPAPFSIDSGSPFTLLGTGATAAVTVRFTPTSTAVASTSVTFTGNGDTQSRLVSGIGTTASDTKPPLPPATSARPPQSPHASGPSNNADDPRAVIDWLLDRPSSRGR